MIGYRPKNDEPLMLRRCDNCEKVHAEQLVRNQASYYNRKTHEQDNILICDHCDYTFRKEIRQQAEKRHSDVRTGSRARIYG